MRFTVIGTDPQGSDVELTIDAKTADHAEYIATKQGVIVQRVKIAVRDQAPAESITAAQRTGPAAAPQAPERAAAGATCQTSSTCERRNCGESAASRTDPPDQCSAQPSGSTSRDLGRVALGLGVVGLLMCWIPVVGAVSMPICLIGLCAGGFGAWTAHTQLQRSRRASGSLAMPVGGAAVSLIALTVSGIFSLGPADAAEPPVRAAAADRSTASASTPVQQRSLAIVGSHTSGDGGSIFTSKPRPVSDKTPAEPPKPVMLGSAEIELVSAQVESVLLAGDQGRLIGETTERMLVVKVRVRNTGETPIQYKSLAGDEGNLDARAATLADERGVRYRRATFEIGIHPAGRVAQETLDPGRTLTDALVFHVPPEAMGTATLVLQGRSVGVEGTAELTFPASLIKR
ncbi:MAG: hypothetical protein ACK4WH_00050 [Phycisphaerales bacterium]